MQTLSNGIKLPETGDKGSVFFPALEDNLQQLNDHTHNGTDSERLDASSVTAVTDTILSASWVPVVGETGTFEQTVTMPTGMLFDDYIPSFRNASGEILLLSVEKLTASTYNVKINDATLTLTVIYK